MTAGHITKRNLDVLKSESLELPRVSRGRAFDALLESTFDSYLESLGGLEGQLAELVDHSFRRIETLARSLVEAWRRQWDGDEGAATAQLAIGLDSVKNELAAISVRHEKILPKQSWYRLAAWEGVSSREHMFHTPFELEHRAYRFSAPGTPSLYLANSTYLCWLECGEPDIDQCFISRFEIDTSSFKMLHIPATSDDYVQPLEIADIAGVHPRSVMNSPYDNDVATDVAEFLAVWPLIAMATMRKRSDLKSRQPEYVVPQLLMLWIRESADYLGLRYLTSKDDRSTNSQDFSINLALPARQTRSSGYCEFLASRARWTEPQRLALMDNVSVDEVVSKETADRRQSQSGKVMLSRDGAMTDYITTEFGKMEYWLDRPELELATIETLK